MPIQYMPITVSRYTGVGPYDEDGGRAWGRINPQESSVVGGGEGGEEGEEKG